MQCKHVKVFGIVQGVGFRYYTERLAHKYGIAGTVENVSDYVEIFAQGEADSLAQFIDAVTQGASPASHVEDYIIEESDINHSWNKFRTI
ncbi:acylphosphatase [Staphylococcus gallinarum]|jgi:acylphosphatase|uniref:acylphosphatase n=1 Tax=Staphylococcus gallinarum TaxID=1293 RepID=A0A2T4SYU8_STAGA|nr:acylphosphatase [Staphylococcus gallinarum]MCD8820213.1 acylphosphatase [Staphylococcus gallinarum]MCD8825809.1 acylphosphatase [Staphylococcus gallinarum]MCD8870389.1 acylphosphatase [Staphylococcus gallinarum]MCQ9287699.1 acylphosphatase [Staphylococcus gallinarum]MCW0984947.1 acylphosphatase [Staphylococcus gallinarum]